MPLPCSCPICGRITVWHAYNRGDKRTALNILEARHQPGIDGVGTMMDATVDRLRYELGEPTETTRAGDVTVEMYLSLALRWPNGD